MAPQTPIPQNTQRFIDIVKFVSISTSLVVSGYCWFTSYIVLPAIHPTPGPPPSDDELKTTIPIASRVIRSLSERIDNALMITPALPAILILFLSDVESKDRTTCWTGSALLLTGAGLWTSIFMRPPIEPVMNDWRRKELKQGEVMARIEEWDWRNKIRTRLVFFAGALGVWAGVNRAPGLPPVSPAGWFAGL